jgi:ABC-type nitrate/sulfonate/bicarbonate transport system permease component
MRIDRLSGIAVLIAMVVLWELLAASGLLSANQVPGPSEIGTALWREFDEGELARQVLVTARRILIGYLLAVALGVPLGFALGRWRALHAAFEPLIEFARPMPVVAILPIAIFVLGLGDLMACSVIAFASGWIVLLHAMDGIRSVDPVLLDTGRVFRVSGWRQFVTILLPAAAPHTFTGLRVALGIAVIVTVVIELISGFGGGLGAYIGLQQAALALPEAYAGIVLTGIVGYAIGQGFLTLERRLMAWHHGYTAR